MDEKSIDISSRMKFGKPIGIITSKSKTKKSSSSFSNKLLNIFIKFRKIFSYLTNKIRSCMSKCSILIQFPLFLIPISIFIIILILSIHIDFYSILYAFNFSKAFKEEFLDLYITKIDDLKTELTSIVIKDTKIDVENQIFFQVYFKELATVGLLDEDKSFFPSFYDNPKSTIYFSRLNNFNNIKVNFNIPQFNAVDKIEERYYDKLGNFAMIYYYMFPYIWYESVLVNSVINQSFFIAYEMGDVYTFDYFTLEYKMIKGVLNKFLFFRYPKQYNKFEINNNFSPNDYVLNPYIEVYDTFEETYGTDDYINYYHYLNWFKPIDYNFRVSTNNTKYDQLTNISFAHFNKENDRKIYKTFITYAQQYIKQDGREYIVNIIFNYEQINLKEGDYDYTLLIVKNNFTDLLGDENDIKRFSDNDTYVISLSDETEYALSEMDFRFFHLNSYEKRNNFYINGISFDSFNLEYFYDFSKFYSTSIKGEYDLKFYVTLYLYKSLFQNSEYKKIQKKREEIFLYNFKNNEKIKRICKKINFNSYRNYLLNSGIDCWNKRNKKFYNKENYLYIKMNNDSNSIEPIYPYCSCLPLYCLKNYEELDENLAQLEFVDEITLPNKCQNRFLKYERATSNTKYSGNNTNKDFIDISSNIIDYDYIKFKFLQLNQLPGYFLFVFSQIKATGETYIHTYYKILTKIEIIILSLVVIFIASILSIIIIYKNMKKFSLVISKFKNKFEFYVFNSEKEVGPNINNNNNLSKYIKNKEKEKMEKSITFFNINDNNLLDDLFLIFSQTYNIRLKDIEKIYSNKNHKSKNQMKLDMMKEKNELFRLLSTFCLYAPFFKLNLNFDYNMYEYSEIIKKYIHNIKQLENIDKEQIRLTKNTLNELISTECIDDYGLITNFKFGYITHIQADTKKNSIKFTMFENIGNLKNRKLKEKKEEVDKKNEPNKKLVLKRKDLLLDIFEDKFEADDYLNFNNLNNAFNFFLINSYYKYYRQISSKNNIS